VNPRIKGSLSDFFGSLGIFRFTLYNLIVGGTFQGPTEAAMAKKTGRPPSPEPLERVTVINLKGTAEFRAWLDAFSEETHIPAASLVRLGLGALAKEHKRPAPPKM
jgi:hypothetical protein